jgi:nucleoside diphosphate kinase
MVRVYSLLRGSIRALFGTDGSHNATHGSDGVTSAEREIDIIFGQTEGK